MAGLLTLSRLKGMVREDAIDEMAHLALGQEYLAGGRFMQAGGEFRRVVEINPELFDGWYGLGEAMEIAGVYKEAAAAFGTAAGIAEQRENQDALRGANAALARLPKE